MKKKVTYISVCCMTSLLFVLCGIWFEKANKEVIVAQATITYIGDIMMHDVQLQACYRVQDDSFDLSGSFKYIQEETAKGDYTIGNLETTLADRNQGISDTVYGYGAYPFFHSPKELASAIKEIGVDFVQTCNNHSLDSRQEGLRQTLDALDEAGLMHTGTFRTKQEEQQDCIIEVKGIRFGIVAYTYGTNGIKTHEEEPYSIHTLEDYREDKIDEMCERVRELTKQDVDVVCALIHFGTEYKEQPDHNQKKIADALIKSGADVVLGGHPHVVQPLQQRTVRDDKGKKHTGYVIYAVGNFLAAQGNDGSNRDLGEILHMNFVKKKKGTKEYVDLESIEVSPTYVYQNVEEIGVVPVLKVKEMPQGYPFLSAYDMERIKYGAKHVIEVFTSMSHYEYNQCGLSYRIDLR
ncbi:MAG: CapA family protein [Wujia sp.]